jgi:hypothetical protein
LFVFHNAPDKIEDKLGVLQGEEIANDTTAAQFAWHSLFLEGKAKAQVGLEPFFALLNSNLWLPGDKSSVAASELSTRPQG